MDDLSMITAYAAHQRVRGFSKRTIDRRSWSLTKLIEAGPLAAHTPTSIETFAAVLPLVGPAVPYANGQAVGAALRRLFRRCGIAARPHDARHTFGTAIAVRSNGNVWTVARLMRHASIGTAQRYVRWVPDGAELVAGLHAA